MKKKFFVLLIFIFPFICFSGNKKEEPRLSKRQKEKIELIKKVKAFGEDLGLNPTENFKEYRETVSKYNIFFFSEKAKVPYSYVDPVMTVVQSPYDDLERSVRHYEVDIKKYDVYFYVTIGVSGGTYITKRLLSHGDVMIAQTVLHEDLHDNIDLPRHLEEAVALLFGIAGASRYFKEADRDFRSTMGFALMDAILLDDLHSDICLFNKEWLEGKTTFEEYLKRRDEKIADSWYRSMSEISQHHTYKHYYVLWYRLFKAMDFDLKRFLSFLKEFPFKQPTWDLGHDKYFEETIRLEALAEVFIESAIASLTPILENENIATDTTGISGVREDIKNIHYGTKVGPICLPEEPERLFGK